MGNSVFELELKDKKITLVGTAHISKESISDVRETIESLNPDVICVEIDKSRYQTLKEGTSWKNLNVIKILREKKGFLLLANLVLSSFQKRMGLDLGVKPGDEMLEAIRVAEEKNIPFELCDREVQVTLRRAWMKSNFWAKNKLIAAMLSSTFTKEKLSEEEIEKLKESNALQNMMEELAEYLPSVKEVLIDERDQYLAANIYRAEGKNVVAVVGAGHINGIISYLKKLDEGEIKPDSIESLDEIPPKGSISKVLPWVVPALIVGIIGYGFYRHGLNVSLEMMKRWVLINGTLSAIGAIVALAHPLTVILAFLAAPITSMNPTIGVGIVTGIIEALLRPPRVRDFESLNDDITSFKGFMKNRFTHIFVVFFLSSLGSAIGTFIGIPFLAALLK